MVSTFSYLLLERMYQVVCFEAEPWKRLRELRPGIERLQKFEAAPGNAWLWFDKGSVSVALPHAFPWGGFVK